MKIKKIINKFGGKREKLIKYGAEKVQSIFEEIDGEKAYDEAAKTAIEEIKKHPELALKILEMINENVSSKVVVNTVIQLPEEKEFSEKTAIRATEQLDLEDNHKVMIIEESNLDYESKMEIARQIEDEEIREKIKIELKQKEKQRSLRKLKEIYMDCNENMNELKLQELLDKTIKSIHLDEKIIQEEKNRIIAKKIAFNYAAYGTNIVSKQRNLMTPKQMNEINIVEMAKKEYEKIVKEKETINGHKIREFNEQELRYKILKEIEATALRDEFDEEAALKEIRSMMKTLMYDDRKALLLKLKMEIVDKTIRDTYSDIQKSGVAEELSEFPKKEREKMLEIFKNTIEKRKKNLPRYNVVDTTPKIKSYKVTGNINER